MGEVFDSGVIFDVIAHRNQRISRRGVNKVGVDSKGEQMNGYL